MKFSELSHFFSPDEITDAISVNPMVIAEWIEFQKRNPSSYKSRAINYIISRELPFKSTLNVLHDLCRKIIAVKCPYCEGETKINGSSGIDARYTIHYKCNKCNANISLSFPSDCISANP